VEYSLLSNNFEKFSLLKNGDLFWEVKLKINYMRFMKCGFTSVSSASDEYSLESVGFFNNKFNFYKNEILAGEFVRNKCCSPFSGLKLDRRSFVCFEGKHLLSLTRFKNDMFSESSYRWKLSEEYVELEVAVIVLVLISMLNGPRSLYVG